jgi:hypothetical protein
MTRADASLPMVYVPAKFVDSGDLVCESPVWNCSTLCDDSNGENCGPWVLELAFTDNFNDGAQTVWHTPSVYPLERGDPSTFTFYWEDSCHPTVPPVVWPFIILVIAGLLLAAGSATLIWAMANAAIAMPALYSVNAVPPKTAPPETKKKHWNISAANYLGAAGPLAVKWGSMGEHTEGERGLDTNENTMKQSLLGGGDEAANSSHQLELETPTDVPAGAKQGAPWWMSLVFIIAVILVVTGAVLWSAA